MPASHRGIPGVVYRSGLVDGRISAPLLIRITITTCLRFRNDPNLSIAGHDSGWWAQIISLIQYYIESGTSPSSGL
ncbi:hypothetical protein BDW68DRAFT_154603 [Aspergillus falconensis]